jgi:hypothetical protein
MVMNRYVCHGYKSLYWSMVSNGYGEPWLQTVMFTMVTNRNLILDCSRLHWSMVANRNVDPWLQTVTLIHGMHGYGALWLQTVKLINGCKPFRWFTVANGCCKPWLQAVTANHGYRRLRWSTVANRYGWSMVANRDFDPWLQTVMLIHSWNCYGKPWLQAIWAPLFQAIGGHHGYRWLSWSIVETVTENHGNRRLHWFTVAIHYVHPWLQAVTVNYGYIPLSGYMVGNRHGVPRLQTVT